MSKKNYDSFWAVCICVLTACIIGGIYTLDQAIFPFVVAQEIQTQEQNPMIVMIFSASWCGPCQTMKRTTWSNPQLQKYIKDNGIEVHRIDVDKQRTLAQQYGATSIPCIVVLERISETKAKEISRFIGVRNAKETQAFFESCRTRQSLYSVIGEGISIDEK